MYTKTLNGNHIICVGVGVSGVEIDETEYNAILEAFGNRPAAPSGYDYLLRADTLEWELVALPPEPDPGEEEIDDAEAFDIIFGGGDA